MLSFVFALTLQSSARGVDLDVTETHLQLEAAGKYKLNHKLPYPVVFGEAQAKFKKETKTLEVTIPVVPPPVAVLPPSADPPVSADTLEEDAAPVVPVATPVAAPAKVPAPAPTPAPAPAPAPEAVVKAAPAPEAVVKAAPVPEAVKAAAPPQPPVVTEKPKSVASASVPAPAAVPAAVPAPTPIPTPVVKAAAEPVRAVAVGPSSLAPFDWRQSDVSVTVLVQVPHIVADSLVVSNATETGIRLDFAARTAPASLKPGYKPSPSDAGKATADEYAYHLELSFPHAVQVASNRTDVAELNMVFVTKKAQKGVMWTDVAAVEASAEPSVAEGASGDSAVTAKGHSGYYFFDSKGNRLPNKWCVTWAVPVAVGVFSGVTACACCVCSPAGTRSMLMLLSRRLMGTLHPSRARHPRLPRALPLCPRRSRLHPWSPKPLGRLPPRHPPLLRLRLRRRPLLLPLQLASSRSQKRRRQLRQRPSPRKLPPTCRHSFMSSTEVVVVMCVRSMKCLAPSRRLVVPWTRLGCHPTLTGFTVTVQFGNQRGNFEGKNERDLDTNRGDSTLCLVHGIGKCECLRQAAHTTEAAADKHIPHVHEQGHVHVGVQGKGLALERRQLRLPLG